MTRIPATHPSEFCKIVRTLQIKRARESRVRAAPAFSCSHGTEKCAHEHTGFSGGIPASPCAMMLRFSFALSLATGLLATIS